MGKRRIAFKLAWRKTVSSLWGSHGRMVGSFVFAVALSYGTYGVSNALGREWPGDELIPLFLSGPVLAVIALGVFLFHWFNAPYEQWGNLEERVVDLERRLRPRFSVLAFVGQKPTAFHYGNTLVTHGGTKQTIICQTNDLLRIDVTNVTATALEGCEAYLANLQDVARTDAEEQARWQSMRLTWMPVRDEIAEVDIPPSGLRSVVLFRVINNRVQLITNEVPVRMVHLIQDKGHYQGLVTLTARNAPAVTYIAFELFCDAPESPPYLNIMRHGLTDDDDILGWAIEEQPI